MKFFSAINLFLINITLLVVLFYTLAAFYYPAVYVIATYEDLYGEWAQTYGFLTTCIFSSLIASRKQHPQRWFFLLLALASFYAFMEEISWGQRLIGFDSPAFFHENSYQDETNIHNLLTGPVDVWTKTALTYALSLGLLAYGVAFPVLLHFDFKPALWLSKLRIAAEPPLALIPAFIIASGLEMEWIGFNEAEVAELLVAWALAFTALAHYLPQTRYAQSVLPYVGVSLLASGLIWTTTDLLLNKPNQRQEIEHRLANGYEKFAERYEGYDYTFGVVTMLQRYDELRPNNTVILRKLADNLEILGQTAKAKQVLQQAISVGLRRVNQDSNNVQANISLAKSYRKLGDYQNMAIYANKAYAQAWQQYQAQPSDAYFAYWLAKACEQTNRQHDALHYYRKAHHLDPSSERYAEAYEQKKLIMVDYED